MREWATYIEERGRRCFSRVVERELVLRALARFGHFNWTAVVVLQLYCGRRLAFLFGGEDRWRGSVRAGRRERTKINFNSDFPYSTGRPSGSLKLLILN